MNHPLLALQGSRPIMGLASSCIDQYSPCRMRSESGFGIVGDFPAVYDIYGSLRAEVWSTTETYRYPGARSGAVKSVFLHANIVPRDHSCVIFRDHEQEISLSKTSCNVRHRDRILVYDLPDHLPSIMTQLVLVAIPGYLIVASPSYGVQTIVSTKVEFLSDSDGSPGPTDSGPLLTNLEGFYALGYFDGLSIDFAKVLASLSMKY